MRKDEFFKEVSKFLHKIWNWVTDDKTTEQIKNLVEIAFIVATVVSRFNDVPSNSRKREYVRAIIQFIKYVDTDSLNKIIELEKTLDNSVMESYQLDAILGLAISEHIKDKKELKDTPIINF